MPKLSLEATITTRAEVALKPRLLAKLRIKLDELRQAKQEMKALTARVKSLNEDIETSFVDGDAYEALETGVRITTPFGDVPVKIIKGTTGKKLNMVKLMNTVYVKTRTGYEKASPASLEKCYDAGKDRKPFLGVFFPKDADDDPEDEG